MAENEILSAPLAATSPWGRLANRIEAGEPLDEILPDIQDRIHSALRNVFKKWRGFDVYPKQLFEAALGNPTELRRLLKLTNFDPHAKLLRDVATESHADLESLLRSFLNAYWERMRDILRLDSSDEIIPDTFVDGMAKTLERLTRKLAKDPSRVPPRPRRHRQSIDDILDEQLPLA